MSYEHKSNVGNKKKFIPLRVIISVILILVVFDIFAPQILPNFFTKIVSPFWNIGKPSKEELGQIALSTQFENALIDELQKENAFLKGELGRSSSSTPTLAYILKKPPFSVYDSFIIDVGTRENIKAGEKVYAHGGILIGEVAEVFEKTAKVKLYSTYGEKYEVLLAAGTSTKDIQVTATGRGGGAFEIVVPRDMKVKEGDTVTIPGLSNNVFGIVKDIVSEDSKTFSNILFSQPVNIYELKWVELFQD